MEDEQNANAAQTRRIAVLQDQMKRKMDVVMVSAYHQARGLVETLAAIDMTVSRFSPKEKSAIRSAHAAALTALTALDAIVLDAGNIPHPNIK